MQLLEQGLDRAGTGAQAVADQLWSHWVEPSGNFFLPLTLILSPAIRFAAGEKRQFDSYCFVDP